MITLYGNFSPFMIIGSCLATAGAGLISTFNPQSSPGIWIGYQILAGTAFGLAFQAPIMAAQALAADDNVATTTAILYCKHPPLFLVTIQTSRSTFREKDNTTNTAQTQSSNSSAPQSSSPPASPSSATC